jgi:hypothetical protein
VLQQMKSLARSIALGENRLILPCQVSVQVELHVMVKHHEAAAQKCQLMVFIEQASGIPRELDVADFYKVSALIAGAVSSGPNKQ